MISVTIDDSVILNETIVVGMLKGKKIKDAIKTRRGINWMMWAIGNFTNNPSLIERFKYVLNKYASEAIQQPYQVNDALLKSKPKKQRRYVDPVPDFFYDKKAVGEWISDQFFKDAEKTHFKNIQRHEQTTDCNDGLCVE